jgi:hypothetical protein
MPYLRECDPLTDEVIRASKTTAVRYAQPAGANIHMDVTKIGRIPDGGAGKLTVDGWATLPPVKRPISDLITSTPQSMTFPAAYSEILPDEKATTCGHFLAGAAEYFAASLGLDVVGVVLQIAGRT